MGFIFTLILFVVSFVLSELLRPKPKVENARPANLGDFSFPTATQGRIVPLVWGTVKLEGPNVVWYGDLRQIPIKEKIKTGMFSSTTITKGYRYYVGVQHGLCRGTVDKLLRIWVGDDVIWSTGLTGAGLVSINEPGWFGGDDLGNGGIVGDLRFFVGSEAQAISTYLSTFQQQGGDTPAYRGTCYAVWEGGYLGNSETIQPWRFEVQRIPNGLSLGTPTVNTNDANPANVIYELLTNTDWGLGFPASDIDTTNFTSVASTLNTEGNGFSFILDQPIEVTDFLRELERQIDGVVILDRTTGKWKINLARGGYSIPSLPLADPDNVVEVRDYSRGAWDETANEVRVNFTNRANEYISDFAPAQDMANIRIQNANVVVTANYPGVKDSSLANNIAWRDLRSLSRPLAKVTLIVNREFYAVNPGDVIAWTDPDLGITTLPMRITKVDIGTLEDGKITITATEDVFTFEQPSFASPSATNWTAPQDTIVDIPVADRTTFEAPKAFADRDPKYPGVYRRVWFGARYQDDGAVQFDLVESGEIVGSGAGFLIAGKLNASLAQTAHGAGVNIDLLPDPDTKADLLAAVEAATQNDIGIFLANVVLVGSEFIGFQTISDQGTTVRLTTCYRGLMDSAVATHAANDRVWFLFVSGTITDSSFSASSASIKPIPYSRTGRLAEGSATASSVSIGDRHLKPYPPNALKLNTSSYPASVALNTSIGAADDGKGAQVDYVRKDYRTGNEATAVVDETTLPGDFPTANNTRYAIQVRNDPGGSDTLLYTTPYATGNQVLLSRTQILRYTAGAIPSTMRIVIKTRHTIDSVDYDATQDFIFDFSTTDSELSGLFNLGSLNDGDVSNSYTAPDTGTYQFDIFQDVITSTNAVQARINGGSWVNVITAGNTTGNLTGVTASDTVEVRHTENSTNTNQTLLKITAPTAGLDAYGVLII